MINNEFVVVLSDIHIGTPYPTVPYRKEIHEPFLIDIFNDIIACADQIRELVLLGDFFDFWSYPPGQLPPTLDDIIVMNPTILGPKGMLRKALSALKGRIVFIPGDHDMNITKDDMKKMISIDGYIMKYHWGAYIPSYDTSLLLTHGNEFYLLESPYYRSKLSPLPIGYFMTRSIAYRIEQELYKTKNKSVAYLSGEFIQNIKNSICESLQVITNKKPYPYFIRNLIDAIIYTTKIPRNQCFHINNNTAISFDTMIKLYDGLLNSFVKDFKKLIYYENKIQFHAFSAAMNQKLLPYLAKRYAIEQNADIAVLGHTHVPISLRENAMLQYFNTGSMCPTLADIKTKGISFGMYHCIKRSMKIMNGSSYDQVSIRMHIAEESMNSIYTLSKPIVSMNQTILNNDHVISSNSSIPMEHVLEEYKNLQIHKRSNTLNIYRKVSTNFVSRSNRMSLNLGPVDLKTPEAETNQPVNEENNLRRPLNNPATPDDPSKKTDKNNKSSSIKSTQ